MLHIDRLRLPVIAAPMFLVSGPELVKACCQAGIIGTFPALNCRSTEQFEQWLVDIKDGQGENSPGFGVNLIVHQSNPRLQEDLACCVKHQVPLIITSLGAVPDVVNAVHSYGGKVFHDVVNARHGRSATKAGVDGLIAVSAGAGGHAGSTNPFALLAELRQVFDGPIALAGALSHGGDVAAALAAGADYAYMGTRLISTVESVAQPGHKQMIQAATSAEIVYTDKVSGISANFLGQSLEAAKDELAKNTEHTMASEAKAWRDIWSAGHGVGAIDDCPAVATLVDQLAAEFIAAQQRLAAWSRA